MRGKAMIYGLNVLTEGECLYLDPKRGRGIQIVDTVIANSPNGSNVRLRFGTRNHAGVSNTDD